MTTPPWLLYDEAGENYLITSLYAMSLNEPTSRNLIKIWQAFYFKHSSLHSSTSLSINSLSLKEQNKTAMSLLL